MDRNETIEEIQETEITTSIREKYQRQSQKNFEQKVTQIVEDNQSDDDDGRDAVAGKSGENILILQVETEEKEEGELLESTSKSTSDISEQCQDSGIKGTDFLDPNLENSLESHPYKDVLTNFRPSEQFLPIDKVDLPKPLKATILCDINTKENLTTFIEKLKECKEIGVDVEHSTHGYKPVTCLVQVSTSDKDYIIDAIALKDEMIVLNEIFTNPSILKIFHASGNDLKWLQELCIYVVNMFDTQKAMKLLGYKRLGLDVFLNAFDTAKDKSMQRVDFRKRPLPPKYKDYARTDSHYLIAIYHKLKNELIQRNMLQRIFEECNNDCKVVHKLVDDASYESVVDDIKKVHERQLRVLHKLNKWRHTVAEYLDQNTGKILSKNNLKALVMEMPTDANGIIKIAKSEHVKEHINEIIEIMKEEIGTREFNLGNRNAYFKQNTISGFNKKINQQQSEFNRPQMQNSRGKNKRRYPRVSANFDNFDLRTTLQSAGSPFIHNKRRRYQK